MWEMFLFKLYQPSQLTRYIGINLQVRCKWKKHLDYTNYPKIVEDDLEEQFVRGSGPGGQATNKTNNCVVLKHKPSNIVVKCHETRSQMENRKIAREHLLTRLDNMINGEKSIEQQIKMIKQKKASNRLRKQQKQMEMKAAFKKSLEKEENQSQDKNE